MKSSTKKLVINQPNNKKYLLEKTVLEMKDQNDNDNPTNDEIKEVPFLIEQTCTSDQRRILHCSDGIIELDENGNPIEVIKKRTKRSVVKHQNWNPIDSIDSPILNSASNLTSAVGRKTLSAIDYVGNMFASFIGITSPKYENEAVQANFDDKERKRRESVIRDAESGWK